MTQVMLDCAVKAIGANSVGLMRCRLIKPRMRGEVLADAILVRHQRGKYHGTPDGRDYRIEPGTVVPASVNLMIRGSPRNREADDLVVLLGIIDDEGKEQRIRVRCKGHEKPRTRAEPAFESIAAIEDTIEQEVAAALQAEVARYDKNGRRGGGLGSMFVKYRDRELTAFGGDAWTEGSSANQEVVADPDAATFHSDNLEVLLSRYTQLPTDDERNRFAHALLKRLQEDKGYARVAYLIVCCLWKIGQLQDALEAMKFGLRENDRVNHGISNALMMFNGLLRFRHPDFTTEALDNLEGFLQGSEEHPFQIRQKIAAIRASRLRAS